MVYVFFVLAMIIYSYISYNHVKALFSASKKRVKLSIPKIPRLVIELPKKSYVSLPEVWGFSYQKPEKKLQLVDEQNATYMHSTKSLLIKTKDGKVKIILPNKKELSFLGIIYKGNTEYAVFKSQKDDLILLRSGEILYDSYSIKIDNKILIIKNLKNPQQPPIFLRVFLIHSYNFKTRSRNEN